MVVIALPAASETECRHERTGRPSISTVQAPHCPSPHPYFVPVKSSRFRRTDSRLSSGGASTLRRAPLTFRIKATCASRVAVTDYKKSANWGCGVSVDGPGLHHEDDAGQSGDV